MAKDPAFLFYYQDFAYGTRKMTFEEKGAYIELLCEQADTGHLTLEDIKRILKNSFSIWNNICNKFIQDENGLFYNEILEGHLVKRRKYTEGRKNNLKKAHMDTHMDTHMENVNEDENINVIKKEERVISSVDEITIDQVIGYFDSCGFGKEDAQNFFSYYSAQNWETKAGVSIKENWQNKVIGWMNNQKQFGDKNGRGSSKQRRKDFVTKDEYKSELESLYKGGS